MNKKIKIILKRLCDWCNKELTVGDHPNCCSDCWDEIAKYYE